MYHFPSPASPSTSIRKKKSTGNTLLRKLTCEALIAKTIVIVARTPEVTAPAVLARLLVPADVRELQLAQGIGPAHVALTAEAGLRTRGHLHDAGGPVPAPVV